MLGELSGSLETSSMSPLYALLLGFIQALTEFLPISSSGHLVIFQEFFQIEEASPAFDAVLHLGTALATVYFYRRRISEILLGSCRWCAQRAQKGTPDPPEAAESIRLLGLIILCSAITAGLGLPLKDVFEGLFENTTAVGVALLLTAVLLVLTRKYQVGSEAAGRERVTLAMAILIGIAQFIAITPGISRSGSTIGLALVLGLRRKTAAEFSFLISIPAILGANLIKLLEGGLDAGVGAIVLGVGTSFFFGLAALGLLVRLVKRGNFYQFAYYLLPLGVAVLTASLVGWL